MTQELKWIISWVESTLLQLHGQHAQPAAQNHCHVICTRLFKLQSATEPAPEGPQLKLETGTLRQSSMILPQILCRQAPETHTPKSLGKGTYDPVVLVAVHSAGRFLRLKLEAASESEVRATAPQA